MQRAVVAPNSTIAERAVVTGSTAVRGTALVPILAPPEIRSMRVVSSSGTRKSLTGGTLIGNLYAFIARAYSTQLSWPQRCYNFEVPVLGCKSWCVSAAFSTSDHSQSCGIVSTRDHSSAYLNAVGAKQFVMASVHVFEWDAMKNQLAHGSPVPGRHSVGCLGVHWLPTVQSTAILSSQTGHECTCSHLDP